MDSFPSYVHLFVGFSIALVTALWVVPIVRHRAIAAGQVDHPGGRKLHRTPVPRLGGVGIFAGFALALLILLLVAWQYPHDNGLAGLLAGGAIIFALGLFDDLYDISPYLKLAGQLLAAGVAFSLGVQIEYLDLPWSKLILLHGFSLPVTILWLVGITNAMNFIDGVDGLAGGVVTLSSLTMAIVALFTGQDVAALLAAILTGSALGFLVYNFHPARIFMGDCGALFCGFMLAGISVTGVLKTPIVVMLLPVVVLTVPILDITYSTLRRILLLKNPFIADADHLHHRLLKAGLSPIRTAFSFYGLCLIAGMVATSYVNYLQTYLILMCALVTLGVLLIVLLRRNEVTAQPAEPAPQQNGAME